MGTQKKLQAFKCLKGNKDNFSQKTNKKANNKTSKYV